MLPRVLVIFCTLLLVLATSSPVFAVESKYVVRKPAEPATTPGDVPALQKSLEHAESLLISERQKGNTVAIEIIDLILRWNPQVTVAQFLPPYDQLTAFYDSQEKTLYFNSTYFVYNEHIVAVILAEGIGLTHGYNSPGFTCIETQVFSSTLAARLWESWFGPQGKDKPGDALETKYNTLVQLKTKNELSATIASEIMYRGGCSEPSSQRPQPSSSRF